MLEFRPHHFLCTLGFVGKGYSPEFVKNFQRIANALRLDASGSSGDETLIQVVEATDSICTPCPNRAGSRCTSESRIQSLDQAHAKVLGIKAGDVLSWKEAKSRISRSMTDEQFEKCCAPCSWKALGVCQTALQKLRSSAEGEPHV